MAISRRWHSEPQRLLTSRRGYCCLTKMCPRDPAPNRRRLPDLPVRHQHWGSASSTLGGNRLTASKGYHSTSPSGLRRKAFSRRTSRAEKFASTATEAFQKEQLGILGGFTAGDFDVIILGPNIEGTTVIHGMLVPVEASVLDMVDCIPAGFVFVESCKRASSHSIQSFDSGDHINETHQKWAKRMNTYGVKPYAVRATSPVESINDVGYEQLQQVLRVAPVFKTLRTHGWAAQYSLSGVYSPYSWLSAKVVESEDALRKLRKYSYPFASAWTNDIDSRKVYKSQTLTRIGTPHLQTDVDLSGAHNVTNCAGEPIVTSGHLTVPSSASVRSISQSSSGRKRIKKENDTGNDSDDDDFRKTNTKRDTGGNFELPPTKFFACPYFKRDPVKHLKCFMRFKLKRVKDVKQHLYRKHSLSEHYCPLCWATFDRRSDYDDHIRKQSCQQQAMPEKYGDFMTVDQKKAISRRTDSGLNEHEQWYNVWRVLFPNEDKPSSPYLKSTEFEELIPIVRWFWRKNSTSIVTDLLSSPQAVTIAEAANTSYIGNNQVMGQDEDEDARKLTETMDVLLDRVEESIQSFRRYGSPSPPSSVLAPSPLLSEGSVLERTEDSLAPSVIPKIEVNELQSNRNTPQPLAVETPSGIPETDFWDYDVFGMSPTDFSGSCEYPESFVP
ncbi:hypothetical protein CI238_00613 [Colletotrichum incanum]|uniref:C2H2-type domain-containing protein n=1 Tax=Colletotrichum incanum TaxID=1573173 RepID=A0A166M2S9_COLIC|nr:hypothetical protein CI238_00613 [Colletotrichum incanum]